MVQLSHPFMTTGKKPQLWLYGPLLAKWCLFFLIHCLGFFIAILPRSKRLLISWFQSLSPLILEPKKWNLSVSTFSSSICHEYEDQMPWSLFFWMLNFSQLFHSPLSSKGFLVPLHFLPLKWYHLHIWDCWYFSQKSLFQLVNHPARHLVWCTLHIS